MVEYGVRGDDWGAEKAKPLQEWISKGVNMGNYNCSWIDCVKSVTPKFSKR